jgi:hypothetical protein
VLTPEGLPLAVFTKLLQEDPASNFTEEGVWKWSEHSPDWIYQGGPTPDHNRDVMYNQ